MFGEDLTDATVDKRWKALSGYLRDGEGWQNIQVRVSGLSGSRGVRVRGFARPGVTQAAIQTMLAGLEPVELEVYTLSSIGDKGWYAGN